SREVLEDALNQFPGTILIVSHDRWFLNAVTNITLEMNSEGIERFQGNYDYWLAKKEARELEAIPPVPPENRKAKRLLPPSCRQMKFIGGNSGWPNWKRKLPGQKTGKLSSA
ncbi:MAG: hypothetical protein PHD92_09795, partial [Eubacteriales bacterium]|nr:hypothetical protein [Eubacteriales bacterium]